MIDPSLTRSEAIRKGKLLRGPRKPKHGEGYPSNPECPVPLSEHAQLEAQVVEAAKEYRLQRLCIDAIKCPPVYAGAFKATAYVPFRKAVDALMAFEDQHPI